jgi:hypothetical protein
LLRWAETVEDASALEEKSGPVTITEASKAKAAVKTRMVDLRMVVLPRWIAASSLVGMARA